MIAHFVHALTQKRMLNYVKLHIYFILITISQSQNPKCKRADGGGDADWAILYKAPGQASGKIIVSTSAGVWANGAAVLTTRAGQSFGVTLEHVVGNHAQIKFLAYNNAPPGMPNVKTKSNSKGVIILQTTPGTDAASWIVHTVPGFPAAKTGYSWPVAENANGHLLICLTIPESQINAIAASLLRAEPLVHYNDIPETETAGMQYFKKLADGQYPTVPPYTSRQSIKTKGAPEVTVNVYSKLATSKYEIYKKVIVKALKKTIKVWSRRDNKLKGDCRVLERNIRLIKSPARVGDHDTNLDADLTNWAVSDPGNIFCHIDRPYAFVLIKLIFLPDLMTLLLKLKTVRSENILLHAMVHLKVYYVQFRILVNILENAPYHNNSDNDFTELGGLITVTNAKMKNKHIKLHGKEALRTGSWSTAAPVPRFQTLAPD
ncbi:Deoxyribonuclease-2-alpha [Trichinella papuae]|uniref:Deoxyribonuclease-2-alpha n=1 Tax=Trichinella papuae TaxID=268474 RepID=A0A0V1N1H1_9BILA|nr:Deoxyribonuclease-2-alpha [Trichinella papuae]